MPAAIDITGHRFGRLVALKIVDYYGPSRIKRWRCRCDCGNTVDVLMNALRQGRSNSCGCLHKEVVADIGRNNAKHGDRRRGPRTREYTIWIGIKMRCLNPRNPRFPDWGGRGITVCKEWQHDYEAFLRDMGRCPPGYSIHRKDNDGPYTKENCIWASGEEQAHNRRPKKGIRGPRSRSLA